MFGVHGRLVFHCALQAMLQDARQLADHDVRRYVVHALLPAVMLYVRQLAVHD